jgi:REP element-mobilizing transposase RayT
MPRIARAVAVGFPHHITQRGNYRQRVFEGDDDYRQYLEWLLSIIIIVILLLLSIIAKEIFLAI